MTSILRKRTYAERRVGTGSSGDDELICTEVIDERNLPPYEFAPKRRCGEDAFTDLVFGDGLSVGEWVDLNTLQLVRE